MSASNSRSTPPSNDQIDASEEGALMIRRHGSSPAAVLEDEDMLGEVLIRLPPQPSSLPRASAVCKRWRGLLTDPRFLRRFYQHHREPPLLGVLFHHDDKINFTSVLPAPDCIPPGRLDLPIHDLWGRLLGCRHGLVHILDRTRSEVLVCDPITGDQHCVPIPPKLKSGHINGAVLCAARNQGHVNGSCHSTTFKVVLLMHAEDSRPLTSVYSSETDTWGDLISTEAPYRDCFGAYISILVGNVLYWSFMYAKEGILGFDLERQSLDVLEGPPGMNNSHGHRTIQAEVDTIVLIMLSHPYHDIQMWRRKVNCHGVASWVLWKNIEINNILGLPPQIEGENARVKFILGHVEDTDGIFLYLNGSVYMVQLKSMQSRKFCDTHKSFTYYHSFKSF